jgi:epoxyqueuosine reductase
VDAAAGNRAALVDELRRIGLSSGLDAVGVTSAAVFDRARLVLESRKVAGLHGGMHFTYGDPERSTDPDRALPGARSLVV